MKDNSVIGQTPSRCLWKSVAQILPDVPLIPDIPSDIVIIPDVRSADVLIPDDRLAPGTAVRVVHMPSDSCTCRVTKDWYSNRRQRCPVCCECKCDRRGFAMCYEELGSPCRHRRH
ncbi:hypothetical protein NP493_3435g00001 [Ridgeia piscesae]|uniref:Uncharacterized protein n=1 Tax=Ridgeia piscesae TaxID=27915 RepID=A0AAD9MVP1_RIDPI|nr:hypothetical protein NP493_3435g00001 [Ridgeia piscesae]